MPGQAQPETNSRITIAATLDQGTTDRFYPFYRAAFEPLLTRAAGRHMLTPAEFADEMADPRIDKYVAWDAGVAVGLTTIATDVAAVPWIESRFYTSRYPQEAARGALCYLGFTLVDPQGSGYRAFVDMIDAVGEQMLAGSTVCGFDFCDYNAAGAIGHMVDMLPRRYGAITTEVDVYRYLAWDSLTGQSEVLDEQHFYIADFRTPVKAVRVPRSRQGADAIAAGAPAATA